MDVLDTPLDRLLGPRSARPLAASFGLRTGADLLGHLPRRYLEPDRPQLSRLPVGEHVTVLAEVHAASVRRNASAGGWRLEVRVGDGQGEAGLTFFARSPRALAAHEARLVPGRRALFAGKVTEFRGARQLTHPTYALLPGPGQPGDPEVRALTGLIPVYPASAAVTSWSIVKAVAVVLDQADASLDQERDPLPAALLARERLVGWYAARAAVHRPASWAEVGAGLRRLRWEEALALQAALAQRRLAAAATPAVPRPRPAGRGLLAAFDARLPFALTAGQEAVGEELFADLARPHPMHRLLQGEVGSGKTVVALRAMLAVVDAGGQAALLAPTEVLAAQHHRTVAALLGPLAEAGLLGGDETGTRLALLVGSQPAAARRQALLDAASGRAGVVVGTHALLEESVSFADLGLVVVDEQHRFGVEQRAALTSKAAAGTRPHVLVMTATPIPRTVAMTVFGDLETSTLAQLPAGRAPVATFVVPARERPAHLRRAWERIREEVAAGHRAFVVCPRIGGPPAGAGGTGAAPPAGGGPGPAAEDDPGMLLPADDDAPEPAGVLETAAELAAGPLAGLGVAVLHGRLPGDEKDAVVARFADPGAADPVHVLVATTVVEVGVDVPAATVMVVVDADRFGVSQLHQLRGRVGRGSAGGLCLLVTQAPEGAPARARLDAVAATSDGFELARLDLEQRREGDVLGAAQSGRRSSLQVLEVLRDEDLVVAARADATALVDADPHLAGSPALARAAAALAAGDQAEYLDKT